MKDLTCKIGKTVLIRGWAHMGWGQGPEIQASGQNTQVWPGCS